MSNQPGILYVVATPIGNLEDLSPRARRVLSEVDLVAAEDTRHSGRLCQHFGIRTPLIAVHDHNERGRSAELLRRLEGGESIALISDAGTPLVSDPGFDLVRAARAAGIDVVPVPGACAAIAALSVAGLPSDRFVFEGFLPPRAAARRERLEMLRGESRTLIFYESPHRLLEALADMAQVLGAERDAVLARELTKQFETVRAATLDGLLKWAQDDPNQQRGEIVLLVHGAAPASDEVDAATERVLRLLLAELPARQAAGLAADITGRRKNLLYQHALRLKGEGPE